MLKRLDSVAWHNLRHAFGEASQVPGWIRDLTSENVIIRTQALEMLYGTIFYQGTVYEATVQCVPFLVEITGQADLPDRDRILIFLARLATADARKTDELGYQEEAFAAPQDPLAGLAAEGWQQRTRRRIDQHFADFLALLRDPQPAVRSAAAYLLACFLHRAAALRPLILRAIGREKDVLARSSMILCLGVIAQRESRYLDCLNRLRSRPQPALVRLTATMAVARNLQENTPEGALEDLVDVLSSLEPDLPAQYEHLPWSDGELAADCALVLCYFGRTRAGQVVPDLLRILNRVEPYSALNVAYALLYFAFGGQAAKIQIRRLSDMQRVVLMALMESDAAWEAHLDMAELLRMFGLPDWPDRIQAFLTSHMDG